MDTTHVAIRLVCSAERARYGWPIESAYVERFWLPVLGPSSVALLRWAARQADELRRYRLLPLPELAASIGLGAGVGRHSPIRRTLERLTQFDAAHWDATYAEQALTISLYAHLFTVPARLAARFPLDLQAEHQRAVLAVSAAATA